MLFAFWKRRTAAATSAAPALMVAPSDGALADWLAYLATPDSSTPEVNPAQRHSYAARSTTAPAPLEVRS
jgi:hypothetical protein